MRDGGQNPGGPLLEVGEGEAQHANAPFGEPLIAACIVARGLVMDRAVDFDAQLRRGAIEVEDERTDRMLPPEMKAEHVAAEHEPEQTFGWKPSFDFPALQIRAQCRPRVAQSY